MSMKPFTPLQSAVAEVFRTCFIKRYGVWNFSTANSVPMGISKKNQKAIEALWKAVERERGD